MDTGEYALVFCMIKAISRYDPDCNKMVRAAAKTIDKELHAQKTINLEQLSKAIDGPQYTVDDCTRFLRLLGKRGFLAPIAEGTNQAVVYRRTTEWPPPVSFFQPGREGVRYFVPK
jgi:hypothetical protein